MDQPVSANSSVPLILALFTFIIIAIKIYYNNNNNNNGKKISSNLRLPPGPKPLPIIGNIHQLITSLPHRRIADWAKQYGPVMYIKLGEVGTVFISGRDAAEEVLRTKDDLFAHRSVTVAASIITYDCRDVAFAPYGDYWKHVRKIFVTHLTSSKQVESFRSIRESEVNALVSLITSSSTDRSTVNLTKMVHSVTTSVISRAAFGDSCKKADAFALLTTRIVNILGGFNFADLFPSVGLLHRISGVRGKMEKLHQEIDEVIEGIISEYRASEAAGRAKGNNILGVLLNLQDQGDPEGSLSMESIKAILFDVFTGGIATSATVIEWVMSEIVRHPQIMKRVQSEVRQVFENQSDVNESSIHQLEYMNAVIKETLRVHPVAPVLGPREARESITIGGYDIPPKTRVLVNPYMIGRDPKVWKDVEKFDPDRFLKTSIDYKGGHMEFIPCGAGRRMCPGIMFGMCIVELTLANLLYHFDWELPGGLGPECLDMSEVAGLSVRRKHGLCLVPTRYVP